MGKFFFLFYCEVIIESKYSDGFLLRRYFRWVFWFIIILYYLVVVCEMGGSFVWREIYRIGVIVVFVFILGLEWMMLFLAVVESRVMNYLGIGLGFEIINRMLVLRIRWFWCRGVGVVWGVGT